MDSQLQRTDACHHYNEAQVKLDLTDVISLQQDWIADVFRHDLCTNECFECAVLHITQGIQVYPENGR